MRKTDRLTDATERITTPHSRLAKYYFAWDWGLCSLTERKISATPSGIDC